MSRSTVLLCSLAAGLVLGGCGGATEPIVSVHQLVGTYDVTSTFLARTYVDHSSPCSSLCPVVTVAAEPGIAFTGTLTIPDSVVDLGGGQLRFTALKAVMTEAECGSCAVRITPYGGERLTLVRDSITEPVTFGALNGESFYIGPSQVIGDRISGTISWAPSSGPAALRSYAGTFIAQRRR